MSTPQPRGVVGDPVAILVLLVGVPLATWIAFRIGEPIVTPMLISLPIAFPFVDRIRREKLASAFWLSLAWALVASLVLIVLTRSDPAAAERAIWRGGAYRDEMFAWIRSGIGSEGTPSRFLPEHAFHFALFLVVSALTFGVAGLVMGAALLGYMNFYVASLFIADASGMHAGTAALMGWPVWAIARVVGFIAGGVAMAWLTKTSLDRLRDRPGRWPGRASHWLSLALALVILDALLKALLAPSWRIGLLPIIGSAP